MLEIFIPLITVEVFNSDFLGGAAELIDLKVGERFFIRFA